MSQLIPEGLEMLGVEESRFFLAPTLVQNEY